MSATHRDYYNILAIEQAATDDEIKKAYRKLAKQHHPDTNNGNKLSEGQFRDIQDAYNVLSNTALRKRYDEELWLAGMTKRINRQQHVTPMWILQETIKLNNHMSTVDVYRMNHAALYDYIAQLLQTNNINTLRTADQTLKNSIATQILSATKALKYKYMLPIANTLKQLSSQEQDIDTAIKQRKQQAQWERALPYVIALITLILVATMYLWATKN